MNAAQQGFRQQLATNENDLKDIQNKLDQHKSSMPKLNDLICDGNGDPCHSICGGAGCMSCGNSISCENGAKQQADTALSLANSTEAALRHKEAMANDFIRNVSTVCVKYIFL